MTYIDPREYKQQEKADNDGVLYSDGSDVLSDYKGYVLDFYHVPTDRGGIKFKAFLESWEDNFEQRWNDENVYGRMDPLSTYGGTGRNISISWRIPAMSVADGVDNLRRVSTLANMQYPVYEDNTGLVTRISTPPIMKVKFANIITDPTKPPKAPAKVAGLLCRMDGITVTNGEEGWFDPEPGVLIPKNIILTVNLIIFHSHKLGWTPDGRIRPGGEGFPYLIKQELGGAEGASDEPPTDELKAAGELELTQQFSGGTVFSSNPGAVVNTSRQSFADLTTIRDE